MALDVKLDPDTGDITIPTMIVRGEDLVIQKVKGRAETGKGEWLIDVRKGVPWEDWLQEIPVPVEQIQDFLKAEFEGVAGVRRADVSVLDITANDYNVAISAVVFIDQRDAPDFRLDLTLTPEEPAVFRLTRFPSVF